MASLADTDVETFANITAASTNSWSAGVYLDDTSSLKIGGKAIVTAKAANDDAWGLNIVGGSESVFADDTAIGVEAGGIGYGVYAATDSTITFGESPLTKQLGRKLLRRSLSKVQVAKLTEFIVMMAVSRLVDS